ncbi:MAG: 50S ribosomal protein L24 [Clostridia bacterium]|nr:50S ribosomal protein L24 [Clostridia bacterium]
MKFNHIKTNDEVIVISGNEKGKKGKVLAVDHENGRVIVENVNMATMHKKPRRQGETGGIIQKEAALDMSNVMHICKKCGKPTRIGYTVLKDGSKVRVCKKCNENFDD